MGSQATSTISCFNKAQLVACVPDSTYVRSYGTSVQCGPFMPHHTQAACPGAKLIAPAALVDKVPELPVDFVYPGG